MNTTLLQSERSNSLEGPSADKSKPNTRQLVLKASFWTGINFLGSQGIRFLGNLLLTRLLNPEIFGLMALVAVFIQGFEMFTDMGISMSIVQNAKGTHSKFINTAWTMQVSRSIGISIVACFLAWPISWFYQEPLLAPLLMACSLGGIITSLGSPSIHLAMRNLAQNKLTLISIISQIFGLLTMIWISWAYHSVWGLVAGSLVAAIIKTVSSYLFLDPWIPRVQWDAESVKDMLQFGRWILLSSMINFIASQGDRLCLGKLISIDTLGKYSLASSLCLIIVTCCSSLKDQVLFPALAKKRLSGDGLNRPLLEYKCMTNPLFCLPLILMSVYSSQIIELIFDSRYKEAGPILSILALGRILNVTSVPNGGVATAIGKPYFSFSGRVVEIAWLFLGMFIGDYFYGMQGVLIAIATAAIPPVLILAFALQLNKIHRLWIDLAYIACSSLVYGMLLFTSRLGMTFTLPWCLYQSSALLMSGAVFYSLSVFLMRRPSKG